MLLPLLLSLTLAEAAPQTRGPVAVVVTSKRPGADAFASKVALRVLDTLKREGVAALDTAAAAKELKAAGFSDPRTCQGGQSCVTKLAIILGPHAVVVSVDVGKVAKSLAIHLEAIAGDSTSSLASTDVTAPADNWGDQSQAGITLFVRNVKAQLPLGTQETEPVAQKPPESKKPEEASATTASSSGSASSGNSGSNSTGGSNSTSGSNSTGGTQPADAPVERHLEPSATSNQSATLTEPAAPRVKVAPWVLLGGAVLAAGAAVTFGVLGLGDKARYDGALVVSPDGLHGTMLSQADALALAGAANTKFTVALISAIVSAVLTGTAVVFFARD